MERVVVEDPLSRGGHTHTHTKKKKSNKTNINIVNNLFKNHVLVPPFRQVSHRRLGWHTADAPVVAIAAGPHGRVELMPGEAIGAGRFAATGAGRQTAELVLQGSRGGCGSGKTRMEQLKTRGNEGG